MVFKYFTYAFAAIAVVSVLAAWINRPKRAVFGSAAIVAGITAAAAQSETAWTVLLFGPMIIWALISALPVMNSPWRLRAGLVVYLAIGAAISVFPTYHDEVTCSDKVPDEQLASSCPRAIAKLGAVVREQNIEAAEKGNSGFRKFVLAQVPFRLVRGLDLKGGLRLVYTVDVQEAIKDKRDRYYDDMRSKFTKALGLAAGDTATVDEMAELKQHMMLSKPRTKVGTVIVRFNKVEDAKKVINEKFLGNYLRELRVVPNKDGQTFTFQIRNDVEVETREKAVTQAKETILRRIDGMGVKEASVSSRDEDIIVEIPGQNDEAFQQIRDIISQTARLEFKMLDDEVDFLKPIAEGQNQQLPKGLSFSLENAPIGKKGSKANYYGRLEKISTETMEEALKRMKAWVATLTVDEDHELGFGKIFGEDEKTGGWTQIGWRTYYLKSKAELTGDMVRDAQAVSQQSDSGLGGWQVNMQLGPQGAELFEKITGDNIKRRFAIILDERVESAPVIEGKIPGGNARITMGAGGVEQQLQDAKKLELVLRSGALPAPISPSNEQRIGASLGADSIAEGTKAAGFAGLFVLVLIILYYRRAGFIADIAVMFNLVLQLTVLSMFSASMTLPGIAGLALTVGVAVDANVLINERIREELRAGKSARAAVTIGYEKAFSAIIDGHATTLISGLILAQYGTGPIKGFAVTLIIGMVTSLFTGVVVTRLFFEFWIRGRRDMKLSIGGRF